MFTIDKEESAVGSPDRPTGELQEKAQALADLAVRDALALLERGCEHPGSPDGNGESVGGKVKD